MKWIERFGFWLALALAMTGGACLGWVVGSMNGRAEGKQLERAAQNTQAVTDLTHLIDTNKGLIADAAKASKDMRAAVARRQAADGQSTQELRDALSLTAGSRTGCLFDTDSVRHLAAARDRAAQAAAGGIRSALPAAAASADGP